MFFILIILIKNKIFIIFQTEVLKLESPKFNQFSELQIQTIWYQNEFSTTFCSLVDLEIRIQTHRQTQR